MEFPMSTALTTDLRLRLGDDQVADRPLDLARMAHDASHYLLQPRVVVTARDGGDDRPVIRIALVLEDRFARLRLADAQPAGRDGRRAARRRHAGGPAAGRDGPGPAGRAPGRPQTGADHPAGRPARRR